MRTTHTECETVRTHGTVGTVKCNAGGNFQLGKKPRQDNRAISYARMFENWSENFENDSTD